MPLHNQKSSALNKFPWTLLLIVYMLIVHFMQITMSGVAGYVFLGLCVFVLFAEFFKSGDISPSVFFVDSLCAIFALTISTWLLTYLVLEENQMPSFYHWFGFAVILGDAIFSPFNAFRTALRNFGLGN